MEYSVTKKRNLVKHKSTTAQSSWERYLPKISKELKIPEKELKIAITDVITIYRLEKVNKKKRAK
jgi:hypothetical protein